MIKNISDYINAMKKLHTLEKLRNAVRAETATKNSDPIDWIIGCNTEYDAEIEKISAEADKYRSENSAEIDKLAAQYGAHKDAYGYYYINEKYTSYSDLFDMEITSTVETPFSLYDAINGKKYNID